MVTGCIGAGLYLGEKEAEERLDKDHLHEKVLSSDPDRTRPKLRTVTAADLCATKFSPIGFVIPGYIAEGLTVLAGRPKVGKSWLALGWATSVATGGVALGSIAVEQGDALYLGLEDNLRRLRRRLDQTLAGAPWPRRLHLATECPRLGNGGPEAIETWIDSVDRPRFVGIDVFTQIRPPRRSKTDLYVDDYQAITPLKELADNHGIAIVAVMHLNKREEPTDPFDAVSGTTGITAAADTVLILTRTTSGPIIYGRGRDIEEIETALVFDRATGLWRASVIRLRFVGLMSAVGSQRC
jgi:hypothetical protein